LEGLGEDNNISSKRPSFSDCCFACSILPFLVKLLELYFDLYLVS
jgi:hypothetical protein